MLAATSSAAALRFSHGLPRSREAMPSTAPGPTLDRVTRRPLSLPRSLCLSGNDQVNPCRQNGRIGDNLTESKAYVAGVRFQVCGGRIPKGR
jgi:hypothetical protein